MTSIQPSQEKNKADNPQDDINLAAQAQSAMYAQAEIQAEDDLGGSERHIDGAVISSSGSDFSKDRKEKGTVIESESGSYILNQGTNEPGMTVLDYRDAVSIGQALPLIFSDSVITVYEVEDPQQYIDPADPKVQQLLEEFINQKIITENMDSKQIISRVAKYLADNFKIITDSTNPYLTKVGKIIDSRTGTPDELNVLFASLSKRALVSLGKNETIIDSVRCIGGEDRHGVKKFFAQFIDEQGRKLLVDFNSKPVVQDMPSDYIDKIDFIMNSGEFTVLDPCYSIDRADMYQSNFFNQLYRQNVAKLEKGAQYLKDSASSHEIIQLLGKVFNLPEGLSDSEIAERINKLGLSDVEIAQKINNFVNNNITYKDEGIDSWESPKNLAQSLLAGKTPQGDCEEYAMLKASLMQAAGLKDVNVAIVRNGTHANAVFQTSEGKAYVLEMSEANSKLVDMTCEEYLSEEHCVGYFNDQTIVLNKANTIISTATNTTVPGTGTDGTVTPGSGSDVDVSANLNKSMDSLSSYLDRVDGIGIDSNVSEDFKSIMDNFTKETGMQVQIDQKTLEDIAKNKNLGNIPTSELKKALDSMKSFYSTFNSKEGKALAKEVAGKINSSDIAKDLLEAVQNNPELKDVFNQKDIDELTSISKNGGDFLNSEAGRKVANILAKGGPGVAALAGKARAAADAVITPEVVKAFRGIFSKYATGGRSFQSVNVGHHKSITELRTREDWVYDNNLDFSGCHDLFDAHNCVINAISDKLSRFDIKAFVYEDVIQTPMGLIKIKRFDDEKRDKFLKYLANLKMLLEIIAMLQEAQDNISRLRDETFSGIRTKKEDKPGKNLAAPDMEKATDFFELVKKALDSTFREANSFNQAQMQEVMAKIGEGDTSFEAQMRGMITGVDDVSACLKAKDITFRQFSTLNAQQLKDYKNDILSDSISDVKENLKEINRSGGDSKQLMDLISNKVKSFDAKQDEIVNEFCKTDFYKETPNGYLDLDYARIYELKDKIRELQDIQRLLIMVQEAIINIQNMYSNTMSGVELDAVDISGVSRAAFEKGNLKLGKIMQMEMYLKQIVNLHNSANKIRKAAEKIDAAQEGKFKAFISSYIAANSYTSDDEKARQAATVFSLASASYTHSAAEAAYSINETYDVSTVFDEKRIMAQISKIATQMEQPMEKEEEEEASGLNRIKSLEKKQYAILNQIDSQSFVMKDGNGYVVDSMKLGKLNKQLDNIQQRMRLIMELMLVINNLQNNYVSTMTGVYGGSTTGYSMMSSLLESKISQVNALFSLLTSELKEIAEKKTMVHLRQKEMSDAQRVFATGITTSLIAISNPVYGSIFGFMANAMNTMRAYSDALSGGMHSTVKFSNANEEEKARIEAEKASNSIDQEEDKLLDSVYSTGIIPAGDGKFAVNYDYLAKVADKIAQLQVRRMIVAMLRMFIMNMQNLKNQTLGGPVLYTPSTSMMVRAHGSTTTKVMNLIVQQLQDEVTVKNAKVSAGRQVEIAKKKLSTSMSFGLAGLATSGTTGFFLGTMVGDLVFSLWNVAQAASHTGMDFGQLNGAATKREQEKEEEIRIEKESVEKKGEVRQADSRAEAKKIDRVLSSFSSRESSILSGINSDLIVDIGHGRWGVSGENLQTVMYKLSQIAQARTMLFKILEKMMKISEQKNKNLTGFDLRGISLESADEILNEASQQAAYYLYEKLDAICTRQHEILAARQQYSQAMMNFFIKISQTVISSLLATKSEEREAKAADKKSEEELKLTEQLIKLKLLEKFTAYFAEQQAKAGEKPKYKPLENAIPIKAKSSSSAGKNIYSKLYDIIESLEVELYMDEIRKSRAETKIKIDQIKREVALKLQTALWETVTDFGLLKDVYELNKDRKASSETVPGESASKSDAGTSVPSGVNGQTGSTAAKPDSAQTDKPAGEAGPVIAPAATGSSGNATVPSSATSARSRSEAIWYGMKINAEGQGLLKSRNDNLKQILTALISASERMYQMLVVQAVQRLTGMEMFSGQFSPDKVLDAVDHAHYIDEREKDHPAGDIKSLYDTMFDNTYGEQKQSFKSETDAVGFVSSILKSTQDGLSTDKEKIDYFKKCLNGDLEVNKQKLDSASKALLIKALEHVLTDKGAPYSPGQRSLASQMLAAMGQSHSDSNVASQASAAIEKNKTAITENIQDYKQAVSMIDNLTKDEKSKAEHAELIKDLQKKVQNDSKFQALTGEEKSNMLANLITKNNVIDKTTFVTSGKIDEAKSNEIWTYMKVNSLLDENNRWKEDADPTKLKEKYKAEWNSIVNALEVNPSLLAVYIRPMADGTMLVSSEIVAQALDKASLKTDVVNFAAAIKVIQETNPAIADSVISAMKNTENQKYAKQLAITNKTMKQALAGEAVTRPKETESELAKKVTDLENNITDINNKIQELDAKINELNTKIQDPNNKEKTTLQKELTPMQDEQNKKKEELNKKKIELLSLKQLQLQACAADISDLKNGKQLTADSMSLIKQNRGFVVEMLVAQGITVEQAAAFIQQLFAVSPDEALPLLADLINSDPKKGMDISLQLNKSSAFFDNLLTDFQSKPTAYQENVKALVNSFFIALPKNDMSDPTLKSMADSLVSKIESQPVPPVDIETLVDFMVANKSIDSKILAKMLINADPEVASKVWLSLTEQANPIAYSTDNLPSLGNEDIYNLQVQVKEALTQLSKESSMNAERAQDIFSRTACLLEQDIKKKEIAYIDNFKKNYKKEHNKDYEGAVRFTPRLVEDGMAIVKSLTADAALIKKEVNKHKEIIERFKTKSVDEILAEKSLTEAQKADVIRQQLVDTPKDTVLALNKAAESGDKGVQIAHVVMEINNHDPAIIANIAIIAKKENIDINSTIKSLNSAMLEKDFKATDMSSLIEARSLLESIKSGNVTQLTNYISSIVAEKPTMAAAILAEFYKSDAQAAKQVAIKVVINNKHILQDTSNGFMKELMNLSPELAGKVVNEIQLLDENLAKMICKNVIDMDKEKFSIFVAQFKENIPLMDMVNLIVASSKKQELIDQLKQIAPEVIDPKALAAQVMNAANEADKLELLSNAISSIKNPNDQAQFLKTMYKLEAGMDKLIAQWIEAQVATGENNQSLADITSRILMSDQSLFTNLMKILNDDKKLGDFVAAVKKSSPDKENRINTLNAALSIINEKLEPKGFFAGVWDSILEFLGDIWSGPYKEEIDLLLEKREQGLNNVAAVITTLKCAEEIVQKSDASKEKFSDTKKLVKEAVTSMVKQGLHSEAADLITKLFSDKPADMEEMKNDIFDKLTVDISDEGDYVKKMNLIAAQVLLCPKDKSMQVEILKDIRLPDSDEIYDYMNYLNALLMSSNSEIVSVGREKFSAFILNNDYQSQHQDIQKRLETLAGDNAMPLEVRNDSKIFLRSLQLKDVVSQGEIAKLVKAANIDQKAPVIEQMNGIFAYAKNNLTLLPESKGEDKSLSLVDISNAILSGKKPECDCEDFSGMVQAMMESAGIKVTESAVVVTRDGSHSAVVVRAGEKAYVLDNTSDKIVDDPKEITSLLGQSVEVNKNLDQQNFRAVYNGKSIRISETNTTEILTGTVVDEKETSSTVTTVQTKEADSNNPSQSAPAVSLESKVNEKAESLIKLCSDKKNIAKASQELEGFIENQDPAFAYEVLDQILSKDTYLSAYIAALMNPENVQKLIAVAGDMTISQGATRSLNSSETMELGLLLEVIRDKQDTTQVLKTNGVDQAIADEHVNRIVNEMTLIKNTQSEHIKAGSGLEKAIKELIKINSNRDQQEVLPSCARIIKTEILPAISILLPRLKDLPGGKKLDNIFELAIAAQMLCDKKISPDQKSASTATLLEFAESLAEIMPDLTLQEDAAKLSGILSLEKNVVNTVLALAISLIGEDSFPAVGKDLISLAKSDKSSQVIAKSLTHCDTKGVTKLLIALGSEDVKTASRIFAEISLTKGGGLKAAGDIAQDMRELLNDPETTSETKKIISTMFSETNSINPDFNPNKYINESGVVIEQKIIPITETVADNEVPVSQYSDNIKQSSPEEKKDSAEIASIISEGNLKREDIKALLSRGFFTAKELLSVINLFANEVGKTEELLVTLNVAMECLDPEVIYQILSALSEDNVKSLETLINNSSYANRAGVTTESYTIVCAQIVGDLLKQNNKELQRESMLQKIQAAKDLFSIVSGVSTASIEAFSGESLNFVQQQKEKDKKEMVAMLGRLLKRVATASFEAQEKQDVMRVINSIGTVLVMSSNDHKEAVSLLLVNDPKRKDAIIQVIDTILGKYQLSAELKDIISIVLNSNEKEIAFICGALKINKSLQNVIQYKNAA
ncbi:MAG: hypothetical protein A2X42_09935 [Candidatus Margulisbacteria bacterium GWF2_38_17]|nr:MAG: hypothetical protein A2X42_09935 [Candidatus Margulisbacteria bacterium GWF2_38_17]